MTIPLSIISEASSGGVSSSTPLAAPMICSKVGLIASVTSVDETAIARGSPVMVSLPFTSIVSSWSSTVADPILSFTPSEVVSPISRLCRRRMKALIASSILFPATRTLLCTTTPPRDMTAASADPPPISIIMLPEGAAIGIFAPIAARG